MKSDCTRGFDGLPKLSYSRRSVARVIARRRGLREYKCPDCRAYHLGSRLSRDQERKLRMLDNITEPVPLPEGERRRSKYGFTYESGDYVEVLAFTAREGVALASRGAPLQITNLTAIEERWPTSQQEGDQS